MCLIFRQALKRMNRELEEKDALEGREPGFRYIL